MPASIASIPATWAPAVRFGDAAPLNTLAAEAYERIRADIVAGRLRPGTKLMVALVKERYGIGGSPMREALTRLSADGLLKNEGQKGFRVASATIAELADIGRLRMHLELIATASAIRNGSVEWEVRVLSEFRRLQHALDSYNRDPAGYADAWEKNHRAFHFAVLSGCESPWLLHFCDRIYDQTERYRRLFTRYEDIPPALISSHKEIVDAVLARNAEEALRLTRNHVAFATRLTLGDMLENGAAPDPVAEAAIAALDDPALDVVKPNLDALARASG